MSKKNDIIVQRKHLERESLRLVVKDKNTYNTLLDSMDVLRIKKMIKDVDALQQNDDLNSFTLLRNLPYLTVCSSLKELNDILSDPIDPGVKRSEYIKHFSSISRSIDSLSTREGSIRTVFTNFPWDDLAKVSYLLNSEIQVHDYKTTFDLDLKELKLRLEYIVKVAELKNPEIRKAFSTTLSADQISIFENVYIKSIDRICEETKKKVLLLPLSKDQALAMSRASTKSEIQKALKIISEEQSTTFANKYQGECEAILKFVHTEDIKPRGLQNIRKITEPILDKEKQQKILELIAKAKICNPSLQEGRAALYAISLMIGEITKNISDQTKQQNIDIPFEQLKTFRNTIHDFDRIVSANSILQCVNSKGTLFGKIKTFLVGDLKNKIEKLIVPDISSSNPTNPNNPLPVNNLLPENLERILEIVKQGLPQDIRTSGLVKNKLKLCEDFLSSKLPIPIINLQNLFSKIFADELSNKTIIIGLNKNHDKVANKNRAKITEDINHLKKCLKELDDTKFIPINKTKNTVQKVGCFEEFYQAVSSSDTGVLTGIEYIEKQLSILRSSLEKINQETQAIVANVNNYQSTREACSNPQFHYFHLFHLLVIGQCIQNLVGKDLFSQSATPELLIEFEFLKWVRNGLMHNQYIAEVGSVFNYFKNDLLNLKIQEHSARTYDSNEYLQHLLPRIEQTLQNIQRSILVKSDMRSLLLKHLELAYNSEEYEVETLIIKALNENHDGNPHYKAEELLSVSIFLDLKKVYDERKNLEKIAKKYDIKIEGFFGKIIEYSNDYKGKSGIFVKCNLNQNLALFKKELSYLLGYRLLVITEDHLREYLSRKSTSSNIESRYNNFIGLVRGENNYNKIMGSVELHFAIKTRSDIEEVKELLQQECNLNLIYHKYAPLHSIYHVHTKKAQLLKLLLDHGANPNVQDYKGRTLAHYAAEYNDIATLELLKSKNAVFTITDCNGSTALDYCDPYHSENKKVFDFLLPLSQLNIEEKIIFAIKREDSNTLEKYLSEFSEENRKKILNTETAKYGLIGHVACKIGNLAIIKLLESNGCDLTLINKDGDTALDIACYGDNVKFLNPEDRIELITHLIDKWKINITPTALHNALYCCSQILTLLLEKGAAPDLEDNNWTSLVLLINSTYIDEEMMKNIKLLLVHGANILANDGHVGNTLHLAVERGHVEVVKLLLDHTKEQEQLDQLLQPSPEKCWVCKGMDAYQIALKYHRQDVAEVLKPYFPNTALISNQAIDNISNMSSSDDDNSIASLGQVMEYELKIM